ncbi:MAG: DUF3344 domain-containing protein [ANME-2 cluster archaeon]|nr:DUF3344 domain-containing protein [ANME-2 cluster archaeon]
MTYRKAKLYVSILNILLAMLLLFFIHPVLADYNYDGSPERDKLITTEHETVIGGVYIDGGHGLENTPYTQIFNVPDGTVTWARLYVGVWGGTDERTGTIDVTFNEIKLDALTLEGKDDTNPDVYCSGRGVYWIGYDVTSNTTSGPLDAVVTTSGDIDGRVYGVMLVAVYEDPDGEEVEYWVNEGNPNLHETNEEAVAEFPGTIELDKFTLGRLVAVYLAGDKAKDYLYFNDETLCDGDNCDDIANSNEYFFDFKTFDVIDYLTEEKNKATFDRGDETSLHPVLAVLTLHTQEEGDSDLRVSNVAVPTIYAGSSNTITATIENIGKDAAYSFQAALYVDDEVVSTASISSLTTEKTRDVDFSWKPDHDGEHVLWVYVDHNDKKTELNEINNKNSPLVVNVIDFTPPEITIDKPLDGEVVDSDTITISGTIEDTSDDITVLVNGAEVDTSGTTWSSLVPLVYGYNKIIVSAIDGANNSATELVLVKSLARTQRGEDSENTLPSLDNLNLTDESVPGNNTNNPLTGPSVILIIVLLALASWFRRGAT